MAPVEGDGVEAYEYDGVHPGEIGHGAGVEVADEEGGRVAVMVE